MLKDFVSFRTTWSTKRICAGQISAEAGLLVRIVSFRVVELHILLVTVVDEIDYLFGLLYVVLSSINHE